MNKDDNFYEEEFYKLMDEVMILFFPDKWGTDLLDYSKNELLTIIFIYRNKNVTVSEIADYLMCPLNTISGVVSRLEKKSIVERVRDTKDKRIVNIKLTEAGLDLYNKEKDEIIYYFKEVYNALTEEERGAIFRAFTKVIDILMKGKLNNRGKEEVKVKKIKKIIIE